MDLKLAKIEDIALNDVKFLEFNRAIKMPLVDKLLSSMTKYDIIRLPVLARTKLYSHRSQLYVIDGQNMITALNKASVKTVKCFVVDTDSKEEIVQLMAVLNNVVCRWVLEDYINAYCSLNMPDYTTLRSYKFTTGFTYAVSSLILGGTWHLVDIQTGKFKAKSKDADVVTKYLVEICALLKTKNAKFMKALVGIIRDRDRKYHHGKFMQALAQNQDRIVIYHDESAMRSQLDNLMKKIK